MGYVLPRKQQFDLLDPFAEAGYRFIGRDAKATELVGQERPGEPDIETAVTDRVEHTDLAGKLERMVEDRQHRACNQAGTARALRRGRQKQHWVRAIAAIIMKIVLNYSNMGKSELFRFFGDPQRIIKIFGTRFPLGWHIRKKLNTELHGTLAAIRRVLLIAWRGCAVRPQLDVGACARQNHKCIERRLSP
jgi:hypothetical protein